MEEPTSPPALSATCHNNGITTGTSRLIPTWALLLSRTLSTIFIFASFVHVWVSRGYSMLYLTNWSFLLLLLSFTWLTASSLLVVIGRGHLADKACRHSAGAHFVASTMALYVVPVYFAFLGEPPFTFANLVVHGLQLIPIAADILLGARYRFRFAHVPLAMAFVALYVLMVWIRYAIWRRHRDFFWPYGFLDFEKQKPGITVGFYIGFIVWAVVAALIILGLSRGYNFLLDKLVGPRSPDAVEDAGKDAEGENASEA